MYFKSRKEAGKLLAVQLPDKYRNENTTVLALSNGGVAVGVELADYLHCGLTLLLTAPITLPRENDPLAVVDQDGGFSYNSMFSSGELEEFTSEYHGYIEQEKLQKFHEINHILGSDGVLSKDMLRRHNVILVSDAFMSSFSLDAAAQFLKPIHMKSLVIAAPIASVQALDRMRTLADDVYCLSVLENYLNVDHYYDEHDVPDHVEAVDIMRNIALHWQQLGS